MNHWPPHITVATVIENRGRFLMVQERDKVTSQLVFNQPAGHLEPGETLMDAAVRETLEETGWQVELTGVLGMALYCAPNEVLYYRTTFRARVLTQVENAPIDPDIHAIRWLNFEEIKRNSARMRSPLVLAAIEQHRADICAPLDLFYGQL